MSDSNVLVVGGNSGIGKATAEEIRQNHNATVHTPVRSELNIPFRDVLDDMVRYVAETGPFTHIVYSAGVNELAWVPDPCIDRVMQEAFDINCMGFVTLVSSHVRLFPGTPLSAVAVSSDAGRIPMRGSVAYCSSKAALNMAVRVMARELAPLHRINAIAPGMVDGTAMTEYIDKTVPVFRGWTPGAAYVYEQQGTPSGRRATLGEVAETIAWVLFGPEQITGAIIDINGGR